MQTMWLSHKRISWLWATGLSSCFLLFSCRTTDEIHSISPSEIVSVFIKNETGIFRGITWGISPDSLMKIETLPFVQQDSTHFLGEYTSSDSSFNFIISCAFEDSQLQEINAELELDEEHTGSEVYNLLREYYVKKYGNPIMEKGFLVWNLSDTAYKTPGTITMTGDMPKEAKPHISLSFFNY